MNQPPVPPRYRESSPDYFKKFWDESWTYVATTVDVKNEPVLLLDKQCFVVAANDQFLKTFRVTKAQTECASLFSLGNKQWDIPELRTLLSSIMTNNTFFNGFIVTHTFPHIGSRVMLLNGRHLHHTHANNNRTFILLAIEDITKMMNVAESLAHSPVS